MLPLRDFAPGELERALASPSPDLSSLLAKEGAPLDMRAQMHFYGVTSSGKFSAILTSTEDARSFSKETLGVDAAAGLDERAQVAALARAWQPARARIEHGGRVRRWSGDPAAQRHGPSGDETGLRHEVLEARGRPRPAMPYLEARQTDIERGDIRAETLTAVYSAKEDEGPTF